MQGASNQAQSPFKALSDTPTPSKLAGLQKSISVLQDSPAATPGKSLPPQSDAEEGYSRWGHSKRQAARDSQDSVSASGRLGEECQEEYNVPRQTQVVLQDFLLACPRAEDK